MCTHPSYINIRPRLVNLHSQPLFTRVSCGHCVECMRAKQDEYFLRSYYEMKSCVDKGGFLIFDTLTYNDQHLPTYIYTSPDGEEEFISAFDRKDILSFWHRLRDNIAYEIGMQFPFVQMNPKFAKKFGYQVIADNLKYVYVAEYGTLYKRPHYHFNLFCSIPNYTPSDIKRHINKAWRGVDALIPDDRRTDYYGETDFGITDELANLEYNTIRSLDKLGAFKYIAKYLTKSSIYVDELISKFAVTKLSELPIDVKPFFQTSLGFGASMVDDPQFLDALWNDKPLIIPDKDKGYKEYAIPASIKRKYLCELCKRPVKSVIESVVKSTEDENGNITYITEEKPKKIYSYYWKHTDKMAEYKFRNVMKHIKRMVDHYTKDIALLDIEDSCTISNILGSRSLEDLALYEYLYKDRMMSNQILDSVDAPESFFYLAFSGCNYVDFDSIEDAQQFIKERISHYSPIRKSSYRNTLNRLTDEVNPAFNGFDKIIDILSHKNLDSRSKKHKDMLSEQKLADISKEFFDKYLSFRNTLKIK